MYCREREREVRNKSCASCACAIVCASVGMWACAVYSMCACVRQKHTLCCVLDGLL